MSQRAPVDPMRKYYTTFSPFSFLFLLVYIRKKLRQIIFKANWIHPLRIRVSPLPCSPKKKHSFFLLLHPFSPVLEFHELILMIWNTSAFARNSLWIWWNIWNKPVTRYFQLSFFYKSFAVRSSPLFFSPLSRCLFIIGLLFLSKDRKECDSSHTSVYAALQPENLSRNRSNVTLSLIVWIDFYILFSFSYMTTNYIPEFLHLHKHSETRLLN